MLGHLTEFVEELRSVGIPVSMVEALDAAGALRHVDLGSREGVRAALGATLIKNEEHQDAFDVAFDVYFGTRSRSGDGPPGEVVDAAGGATGAGSGGGTGEGSGEDDGDREMFDAIASALEAGDLETLRRLVAQAVDRYAGMEPGRPVGGRYYFYRVMRRIDAERLLEHLLRGGDDAGDVLDNRITGEDANELIEMLRSELRKEIVRRLVDDRGPADVAQTLRSPLVEDIDLMHATREELERIERAVSPLARKLATRLAQRRKRGRDGRLDVRRTIRRSLAHGGALLDPKFNPPRRSKPEVVLLCDVSGSMATFARFTMQLTYAIGHEFSKVRSFAFIDGIAEVTGFFARGGDFHNAMRKMASEARLVWRDGHSDYGNSLTRFQAEFGDAVTPRSTVIVAGDARNNYRGSSAEVLAGVRDEARGLFWLNPEARRYWDTGDSIMSKYAPHCDGVYEVRTLRQLEHFVERVALPTAPTVRFHTAVG